MERYQKKGKWLILATLIAFAISSISIVFIPLSERFDESKSTILSYGIGILFWIGLITGIFVSRYTKMALYKPRRFFQSHHLLHRQNYGMFSFEFTAANIVVYSIIAIGFILIVSDLFFQYITSTIMFPIVSVTLFAFELHCVIDGINYKTYTLLKEGIKDER